MWKIPTVASLKESLANCYLNSAEKLPTFHGTAIASLQEIRRHQRKQAAVASERAKKPEGSEIEYPWLRLVELFPLEEYEQLECSLRKLVSDDIFERDFLADFRKTALGLSPLGNTFVGRLSANKASFFPLPQGVLRDLPAEVEAITLTLHKVLPSAFAVTFDVKLNASATQKLRALQAQPCLSTVKFRNWVFWGRGATSHSESTAEAAKQKLVMGWLVELRSRIEEILRPHLSGYFAEDSRGRTPRLPAFEVFSLTGVPTDDGAFTEWLKIGSGWLSTLGTTRMIVDLYGFKGDDSVLVMPAEADAKVSAYRVFSLIGKDVDAETKQHKHLVIDETLDRGLPFFVLAAFLDKAQETVEELRKEVYERLSEKPGSGRFLRDFALNQQLQRATLLLSRFQVEMEQAEERLRHWSHAIAIFRRVDGMAEVKGDKLSEVLLRGVTEQAQLIKNHQALISDSFSAHLSWRNLDLSYRLQRRMLYWTMAVSVATLVSLGATYWPAIKAFLQTFK
jgi:hypothetical protein